MTAVWGSGTARNLNAKEIALWVKSGGYWAEAVPVQNDTFSGVGTVNSQPKADTERPSLAKEARQEGEWRSPIFQKGAYSNHFALAL